MSTERKRVLCFRRCQEVGGGGICWGIRKEPAGNSFVTGTQWGLELELLPAKSPPELPPTCLECLKPEKQGGPPEVVILRLAHLGKRRKEGREAGKGGGRWEKRREGGRPRHIFRREQTHVCTQSQICIHQYPSETRVCK